VTVRVAVARPRAELPPGERGESEDRGRREAIFDGERVEAAVVRGVPAERLDGPAIVELPEATAVVPPGWAASPTGDGTLAMERAG
jgi:N-methylhydantoinase A/oxoprolinase/acetone carboxylase beta subunit